MKINLLIAIVFLSIIIYANISEMHGIIGLTKRDGGLGCLCHDLEFTDSVTVWIEGPDTVNIGDTTAYKLFMTGGPAVVGGFNIAAYYGEVDSADTLTKVLFGELTHSSPNLFVNDTVKWNFFYTAPETILTDTLYSVANSVNYDSIPSELDQWNFGNNFIVNVVEIPTGSIEQNVVPFKFILEQNYPNPFNPSTKIRFTIPFVIANETKQSQIVTLKVYNVLGKEVAVLVTEEKTAGEYEVEFYGLEYPSGVYFYKLESNGFEQTRKMVLLK